MAIGIDVIKEDVETLFVRIQLTGLTPGTRYDVYRLQLRYLGKDDTGARRYERQLPDGRHLWSSVAHRVGWEASLASQRFRDYECPKRPTQYFLVESSKVGPFEYDDWDTPYPVSRGVLDSTVVHFGQDIRDLLGDIAGREPDDGHVLVRSTAELAHYAEACVVEMDGPTYTARTTQHAVMGSQYPVLVSDSREARHGTLTLMTSNLGQYNDLRRVVFPANGKIRPFVMNAAGESPMLLDDMRCIPLDVEVEQATKWDSALRYIHIDYVEVDPSAPLFRRTGDNDDMVDEPEADFTISDTTPRPGQWITLTDTSTGQGDDWDWTIGGDGAGASWVGKFFTQGPHKVRWGSRGRKHVKLRFGGSGQGYHTRTKTVNVGG